MSKFDVGKTDGAEQQIENQVNHRPVETVQISLHAWDRSGKPGVSQRHGGLGLLAIYRRGNVPNLGHTNVAIGAYVAVGA